MLTNSLSVIQQCFEESQKVSCQLQERNQELIQERNEMLIGLKKTQKELTTSNQLLQEQRKENEAVTTEHALLKDKNEKLLVSLQSMEEQVEELKKQLCTVQAENDQLTASQQALEEETELVQEQLLTVQAENEELHRTQQLTKEQNESLEEQLTDIQAKNQQLNAAQQESIAFGIEPWKISRDKIVLEHIIGGGGWGAVSAGKLHVAVKQFFPNILSMENISRLKREMRMLALIRHPNLLQFIAAVFDDDDDPTESPPYIITELLDTSLRLAYEKKRIATKDHLGIFQDTARALDYLHRRHEPIIHRDVSSANVLLKRLSGDSWMAKVSDLGSANLAREAYTMNEGAVLYCAPEAFTDRSNTRAIKLLTPRVDVYSYGIMLCEVATSTLPDKARFPSMLDLVQGECPHLHQLINSCIEEDPQQRPTMATVLTTLEKFPPTN